MSDPEMRAAVWKHEAAHWRGPRAATRGYSRPRGPARAPPVPAQGGSPALPRKLPTH